MSNIRLKPNERYLEDEDEDEDDECFEDEHDYPSDVSEDEYDSDEEPDNLNQQQHEMEKEAEKIQEDISSILKAHGGSINIKEFDNVKRNAKKIS